jgi:hypothetical protein
MIWCELLLGSAVPGMATWRVFSYESSPWKVRAEESRRSPSSTSTSPTSMVLVCAKNLINKRSKYQRKGDVIIVKMPLPLIVYRRVAQIASPAKNVATRPKTIVRISPVATNKLNIS